jgi:hypothetical protein
LAIEACAFAQGDHRGFVTLDGPFVGPCPPGVDCFTPVVFPQPFIGVGSIKDKLVSHN